MPERRRGLLDRLISSLQPEYPFLIDTSDLQIEDERIKLLGQAMQWGLEKAIEFGLDENLDLRVSFTQNPDRVLPELTSELCRQASQAALDFLYRHPDSSNYFNDYWLIVSRRYGDTLIVHQLGAVTGTDNVWYAFSPANITRFPGNYDRGADIITARGREELVENIEAVEPRLFNPSLERLILPYRGA